MKFRNMMRLKFFLCLILISVAASAQNDTTIYYSRLNKVVTSMDEAIEYSELKADKKSNYTLTTFKFKDDKWTNVYEASIQKLTDSTFSYFYNTNKKKVYVRSFLKSDSGYYIKEYFNSVLVEEGLSKTLFPLIKTGHWIQYNQTDGRIKVEGEYKNNQMISNRFGIPDGTFIKDVFTYFDQVPEFDGVDPGLLNFLAKNLRYPAKARDEHITGRVVVSFIIMKDGTVRGIDFVERVHILLDFEALRVVNSIPKEMWTPGKIDNAPVNSLVSIPITFDIKESSVF